MFSRVRVAIRFFFVGLAVGVLLAPRAGIETRRLLRQRADRLVNDLLEAASMGGTASGALVSDITAPLGLSAGCAIRSGPDLFSVS